MIRLACCRKQRINLRKPHRTDSAVYCNGNRLTSGKMRRRENSAYTYALMPILYPLKDIIANHIPGIKNGEDNAWQLSSIKCIIRFPNSLNPK